MPNLTDLQKGSISISANKYIESQEGKLSQAAFAKLAGIDKAYVNQILNNKTHIGSTKIADKYYLAIANYLGVPITNMSWGHFNTYNFKKIINKLNTARERTERCGIDGKSGKGKTYACEMFKKRYPSNTFYVKCSAIDNAKELAQSIANEVGSSDAGTKGKIIKNACEHLINMGNNPMLIIDEAENLKKPRGAGIEMVKVIADLLEGKVAFAIAGLDVRKILLRGSKRQRQGYMQTNRRFSMGWVECSDLTTDDIDFVCHSLGITNTRALNWIYMNINDYDSLKRICVDAIEEAEKSGREVTKSLLEDLFQETTKYK